MTTDTNPAPSEPAVAPEPAPTTGQTLYPDPAPADPPAEPAPAPSDPPSDPAPADPPADPDPTPEPLTADSYAFTYPEGFTPNEESINAAKEIFLSANVPPEAAQKLMDLYTTNLKAATESATTAAAAQFTELNNQWIEATNALPDFQGESAKQSRTILGRAMDEFGSPEAAEAFNLTGAGNNPAIVQYILALAKAATEAAPTPPGRPPAPTKKAATIGGRLYPTNTN